MLLILMLFVGRWLINFEAGLNAMESLRRNIFGTSTIASENMHGFRTRAEI